MKSPVNLLFEEWLTLMEKAYDELSFYEFRELEDKIKHEIYFHRQPKVRRKGI